jgi:hypothetical protein
MTITVLAMFLIWFLAAYPAEANTISGYVKFPDGKPGKNFQVFIMPASMTASPQVRTLADEFGHFYVSGINPGQYAIYPFEESTQYPLRNDMFLSKNPDRATVAGTADVVIDLILPKPAAVINGIITSNKVPLANTQVVLCHSDETWRSATINTDTDGRFSYIVPSEESLSITLPNTTKGSVTVSGFSLTPDENRNIEIDVSDRPGGKPAAACKPFQ